MWSDYPLYRLYRRGGMLKRMFEGFSWLFCGERFHHLGEPNKKPPAGQVIFLLKELMQRGDRDIEKERERGGERERESRREGKNKCKKRMQWAKENGPITT